MGRAILLLLFFLIVSLDVARAQGVHVIERMDDYADTLNNAAHARVDTVGGQFFTAIETIQHRLDSIQHVSNSVFARLQYLLDSIKGDEGPAGGILRSIDSVQRWKDRKVQALKDRIDSVSGRVRNKFGESGIAQPPWLTDRLDAVSEAVNVNLNVDGFIPSNILNGGNLPGLMDPLKQKLDISNIADIDLPRGTDLNALTDIDVGEKATDLTTATLNKVSDQAGVAEIKDEISKGNEVNAQLTPMLDESAAKEMVIEEYRQQAVDHFAGHQAKVDAAIEKLAKFKNKFENAPDITKLPKRPPNIMRDRPFAERLLPGLSFQIHRKDGWSVDVYPYVGYRITGHITTGLGWNYRLGYSTSMHKLNTSLSIFGPRVHGEYLIAKGFSARLETEFMKAMVPAQFSTGRLDEQGREWVFGLFAGMKKSYRLMKRINGTAMALYNVYSPEHRSPYQQRLSLRIGIELETGYRRKAK